MPLLLLLLTLLPFAAPAPTFLPPVCPPLLSERGSWELNASAAPALVLSAFRQPYACRAYPWRGSGLANRSLAFVGDSVSRFAFFHLAWHLVGCPSVALSDPLLWFGPPMPGRPSVPSPAVAAHPTCASLFAFMYARAHGDLFVPVPALNLTLHFLWLARALDLVTLPWVDALLARGEVAGIAAGDAPPQPPRPDAIFLSVGYWDAGSVGERRLPWAWEGGEVDWYAPGAARHCQALSNLEATFREVYLPSGLRDKLVLWATPFSEPYVNPFWGFSAYKKFPHHELGIANRCTADFAAGLGLRFLNSTALLRATGALLRRLELQEGGGDGADGRLFTIDGYHPAPPPREALLDELINTAAVAGAWGGWGAGAPPAGGRGQLPPQPLQLRAHLLRLVGYGAVGSLDTWLPFLLLCLLGATLARAAVHAFGSGEPAAPAPTAGAS